MCDGEPEEGSDSLGDYDSPDDEYVSGKNPGEEQEYCGNRLNGFHGEHSFCGSESLHDVATQSLD